MFTIWYTYPGAAWAKDKWWQFGLAGSVEDGRRKMPRALEGAPKCQPVVTDGPSPAEGGKILAAYHHGLSVSFKLTRQEWEAIHNALEEFPEAQAKISARLESLAGYL